jgi:hypothetical protein
MPAGSSASQVKRFKKVRAAAERYNGSSGGQVITTDILHIHVPRDNYSSGNYNSSSSDYSRYRKY